MIRFEAEIKERQRMQAKEIKNGKDKTTQIQYNDKSNRLENKTKSL